MDVEEYKTTILITSVSAVLLAVLVKHFRASYFPNSKEAPSDKVPIFKNSVELIWKGSKPCFCRNKIVLNIDSTPPHTHKYYCETIAHIFK